MLVRLLYASRVVDPQPDVIESILAQSRQFNPSTGITGILVYSGDIFLQAIEGGRQAVANCMATFKKTLVTRKLCFCTMKKFCSAVSVDGPWAKSMCLVSIPASC